MSGEPHPLIDAERLGYGAISAAVADPILRTGFGRAWVIALLCTLPLVVLTLGAIGAVLTVGIGLSGVNTTVVWGFSIANYVWWIGIGNAGTLISSMLLLTRQRAVDHPAGPRLRAVAHGGKVRQQASVPE